MKTDPKRGQKAIAKKRKSGTENSARRRKQGGKGKPFEKGHPFAFPAGVSGNPGGRPKIISDAYRAWLEREGADGTTNAMRIAETVGRQATGGKLDAVTEMREATEGRAAQPVIAVPDTSDAKQRLAHLVATVAARSGAPEVAGEPDR